MVCLKCGNNAPEGAKFCPYCRNLIEQNNNNEQINQNNLFSPANEQTPPVVSQPTLNLQPEVNNNQTKKKSILPIITMVILIIGVCIFVISKHTTKSSKPNNNVGNDSMVIVEKGNINGYVDPSTNLTYDENGAFLMVIKDEYAKSDNVLVVTGIISRGTVKVNDKVQLIGFNHEVLTTTVLEIESFHKKITTAKIGDSVGIAIRVNSSDDVERGMAIAKPNSIKSYNKFEATIDTLPEDKREITKSYFSNDKIKIHIGKNIGEMTSLMGNITILNDTGEFKPEDTNVPVIIMLEGNVPMEAGYEFTIFDDLYIVARGTVTRVN